MRIVIAAEERENRQPLDRELPEEIAALIVNDLQKFRPRLAPPPLSAPLFFPADADWQNDQRVFADGSPARSTRTPGCEYPPTCSANLAVVLITTARSS
jgi:hypothetical protein